MTEARLGRLLAASLQQAILDVLPQRVDFYEHWLRSQALRDGSIGQAPMLAVLGFLRTEGDGYGRVVARAGSLAAEWTVTSMSRLQRRVIASLPRSIRARAALRVAAGIAKTVCSTSHVRAQVRGTRARLDVKASFFCDVREQQKLPLCGFYTAVAVETLTEFGIPAIARVERCRAVEGATCIIALDLPDAETAKPALAA